MILRVVCNSLDLDRERSCVNPLQEKETRGSIVSCAARAVMGLGEVASTLSDPNIAKDLMLVIGHVILI